MVSIVMQNSVLWVKVVCDPSTLSGLLCFGLYVTLSQVFYCVKLNQMALHHFEIKSLCVRQSRVSKALPSSSRCAIQAKITETKQLGRSAGSAETLRV